jgi:DNA repair protein RadC
VGPREDYLLSAPEHFDDVGLLALILTSGAAGRSAHTIARDALLRFGDLAGLAQAPASALQAVPGLGPARAVQLHAALAAGRRSLCRLPPIVEPIGDPEQAARVLRPGLVGLDHEELHAIYLDSRHRLVARRTLSVGTDSHTIVDPRQVFRPAVQCGAPKVIVAHNHPSGDCRPSEADREVTRRLVDAGRVLGVELLDHLIVTDNATTSLAAEGVIQGGFRTPTAFTAGS